MDNVMLDRARGCAVGAAVGDALGMPLEFQAGSPARPAGVGNDWRQAAGRDLHR